MKKAIIGKKLGMTQIFTTDGLVVPVTVVEAGPCTVVQKKTEEKEGYNSVVVAFQEQKAHEQMLMSFFQQRYKDSNLEMTESESVALPFGDSALSIT